MSMALTALGIDLMLPAFPDIRAGLGLPPGDTAVAGLVTTYFLGLSLGQLVYGPLADRFGRRPTLFLGYGIYAAGALSAAVLPSLGTILFARFVWGFGAAGSRVITLAVVRDRWEGERMARAMSFIMAVFILVPVLSPSLGAAALVVTSWRTLFLGCVAIAAGVGIWAYRRLPETLDPAHVLPLSGRRILRAAREVATNRQTAAYTLAITALFGVFTSYLGSAEAIYRDVFDAEALFPVLFGALAAAMGVAMLVNARIVERFGTRRLAHAVMIVYLLIAGGLVTMAVSTGGTPPLWLFMVVMAPMLAFQALLIPNFNTIAMHPMGAIAGTASSVIGAVQMFVGSLLGAALDRTFDGTITPLAVGFLVYGTLAVLLVVWGERGRLFQPLVSKPDARPVGAVSEPAAPASASP